MAPKTERQRRTAESTVDAGEPLSILDHAPVAIHWVDASGVITWANRTELEMLGYAPDEYIGRHITEFHVDQDVIADILRRLSAGESLSNYPARLRAKDGSIRHGAIDSNVLWQDGEFIHTRCFTRDVTSQVQLKESSRAQFEELQSIYRTAPIGLALIDKELRFARINERLAEINGVSVERHLGRRLRDIVPSLADQAEEVCRQVFRTGHPRLNVEFEGETAAQPGVRRVWNESWYPLKDAGGDTVAVNVVVEEITERKRAEAALAKSARQKEALYQFVDLLHRTQSLDEIYAAAMQAIVTALPCDRASILLFDATGVMRFVGSLGLSAEYCQAVEGHSPWTPEAPDPQPICIGNVAVAEIGDDLKRTVMAEGIYALGFIPLRADHKLIGKFMAYFDVPHVFSNDEIELGLMIGRQLALAIERKRAEIALRDSERRFREMIDGLPMAIYTTATDGRLTHFNPAAVDFAGRTPALGQDRWCVCAKFYAADGTPIRGDDSLMATAVREGRAIRGGEIIAERPDGSRRWFTPYPTPLHDATGRVVGGINVLVDITERKQAEQALAHFAAIVSSSSDAIVSKTLAGVVTSWNASAERMFGYTAQEMVGQPILRLIPPERHAEEDHILACLRAGERIERYETVRVTKDGRRIEVELTISPIKDRAGNLIGASKIARDITERKRAEERVAAQARQLALITDTAPVFIAHCDTEARFKFVNQAYAARFGWRPQDCVGKRIADVVGEPAYAAFRPYVDTVLRGEPVQFDIEVPYDAVGPRFMHCSYVPEFDGGKVVGWVAAVIDITDRRRVEQALRLSEEKLRETDRRKDEFLAMLAHELRNPLAPITNAVCLLRRDQGDPAQQQAREIIERQTHRLARLVDDLLEVARITSGRIRLQLERVKLTDIVQRAVETVRPLIEHHRHTLAVTLPPTPVWLHCDPARIEQALVNLMNNAAKYTDDGGRIDVNGRVDGGEVLLSVRDNGMGIESELLTRVFDLFTQATRSLDRSHGGLGIGLSLVRRLVTMHGGSVEVTSAVGRGSEFVIRLPTAAPATDVGANAHAGQADSAMPLSVLVVDDNVDAAQSLAILLEASGHTVYLAHDGIAALDAVYRHRPQVLLLDVGLPKLDGCEVAARLRQDPTLTGLVIVAMTGYGQQADRDRTRRAGFDQHLVKPVDITTVEQILANAGRRQSA